MSVFKTGLCSISFRKLSVDEVIDVACRAGDRNREDASDDDVHRVVTETLRIADLALAANVTVAFEFHGGTLTNSHQAAALFAAAVEHENVKFYWQPTAGADIEYCMDGLKGWLDRLSNVHVFHWTIEQDDNQNSRRVRRPLAEGKGRWTEYLQAINTTGRTHWLHLEFAPDDSPAAMIEDAGTLRGLIGASP